MIQLIPDVRPLLLTQKICNQSSFSRAGVGRNQRHWQCQVCLQTCDQTRTRQNFRRRSRRQKLGSQKKPTGKIRRVSQCCVHSSRSAFLIVHGYPQRRSLTGAEISTAESVSSIGDQTV